MRRNIQVLIAVILLPTILVGQEFVQFGKSSTRIPEVNHALGIYVSKPFDVLNYSLEARLAMVDSGFTGLMQIRCRITQPTDSLWFHALGLIFSSITVNGVPATFVMNRPSESFSVFLPRLFAIGETTLVEIAYQRDLSFRRFEERQGYYWYRKNYQPGLVPENIGYTFSEPYDARLWMPCFDDPSDKATCSIEITVPNGYTAASNGLLIETRFNPDSTTSFRWIERNQIATYLMVIAATRYSTFSHWYRKETAPAESLEVKYYMWQEDSAGTRWNAVQALGKTVRMMQVYSRLFGEYPFEKYGMATVYPFSYGGMEHQTLSTIHRSWLSVAGFPHNEDGIAHELAHQWWGNLVTCGTFADIWLNEGFASYAEALWREEEYSDSSTLQKMKNFRIFDGSWRRAMYDPVGQGLPLFNGSVYYKGAWVLHMLRNMIGDSLFFAVLRNYRTAYSYGTAITSQFQQIVNATTGNNYDWFFGQWVFGRGWPVLAMSQSWDPNTRSLSVTVYQRQDTLWPTFRLPLEIHVFASGSRTSFRVVDTLRTQTFVFALPTKPDSLQLDPQNLILRQLTTPPPGSGGDPLPERFVLYQNYPNPFNPWTVIEYDVPTTSRVSLEVYDVLGRIITTLVDEVKAVGSHRIRLPSDGLASGVYLVRLKTNQTVLTRKMIILR